MSCAQRDPLDSRLAVPSRTACASGCSGRCLAERTSIPMPTSMHVARPRSQAASIRPTVPT
eukprot:4286231-Alexandrium_andersonii.AAC.1